jgi:hypothetical protein
VISPFAVDVGGKTRGMSQPEPYRTPPGAGETPREARSAQRRLPIMWVVIPLSIAAVLAIAFLLAALF